VDLGAGLDDLEKRKFLTLPGLDLRPLGRPATVASRYTDYAIPAPFILGAYINGKLPSFSSVSSYDFTYLFLTLHLMSRLRKLELYLHYPIHLHDVLN
jgi:hypothetical protein